MGYPAGRPESISALVLLSSPFSSVNRVPTMAHSAAMTNSDISLSTPDTFPVFPYDNPYDIQLTLMRYLYSAIEDRAVAVVESPTGTVG